MHLFAFLTALLFAVALVETLVHIERGIAKLSANQDKIDAAAAAITAAAAAIQGEISPLSFDGLDQAVSGLQSLVPAAPAPDAPTV